MLHQRIGDKPPKRDRDSGRARIQYAGYKWQEKYKRRLYVYIVHTPDDKPYIPSDEALQSLIGALPRKIFKESERFYDRDIFYILAGKLNLFSSRSVRGRQLREAFLREFERLCLAERDIPPVIRDECQIFFEDGGFVHVELKPHALLAQDANGREYARGHSMPPMRTRAFNRLWRACKDSHMPPFTFKAAQQ